MAHHGAVPTFVYIEICKAMGVSSGFSVEDERFNPEEDGHGQEANMIKEKYESTKSAYTSLFQSNPLLNSGRLFTPRTAK